MGLNVGAQLAQSSLQCLDRALPTCQLFAHGPGMLSQGAEEAVYRLEFVRGFSGSMFTLRRWRLI